jgi:predicted ATPase/DNA-binding CsgD family transcriptional regulator
MTTSAKTDSGIGAAALPLFPAPLIGRSAELAALATMLTAPSTRLLTLTGPPGVGKTRLALATASVAADGFADGGRFVNVAALHDPAGVIAEVARVLGVGEAPGFSLVERLITALADKELLLVVDNCEHVIEAGGELSALIGGCPRLRIVATSRERFRLALEREFPVPPLAMPEHADVIDLARLAANSSVALLVERTHAVLPDFTLTTRNAPAVAEICVRLDGLPLALELAAARLKLFTPSELAARLGDRMRVLTGGARDVPARHRTLRAAIGWSHDLLTAPERMLFRRLAVFAHGWTLEAAEQVCAEPGLDVLAATSSLVEKSLLRRATRRGGRSGLAVEVGGVGRGGRRGWPWGSAGLVGRGSTIGEARSGKHDRGSTAGEARPGKHGRGETAETAEFRMLESLREYADEQLAEAGELEATQSRHAAYFAELAAGADAGIGTQEETFWFDWIGHEQGNLRAALDHCLDAGDIASAHRLGAALGWYSYTRGYLGEGQATLDRVLLAAESPAIEPPPDEVASVTLLAGGVIACGRGDLDYAESLLRRSVAASEPASDIRRTAIATAFLGHVARGRGNHDEALTCYRRAGALFEELGNPRGVAWAGLDLGLLARERGDLAEAEPLLRDSLNRFRDIGYPWAIAWSAWALGTVLLGAGRYDEAAPLLVEALDGTESVDDRRGVAQCLEALAGLASAGDGSCDTAARLLGAAAALRLALAAPLPAAERRTRDLVDDAVSRALDTGAYEHARHAGRTMPLGSAVRLARSVGTARREASPVAADVSLTRRERQVAALVATGRTNRQIGRALGIAEKTTEVHVHNIMGKLGAHSRAEVAAWAVSRGLHRPSPPEQI